MNELKYRKYKKLMLIKNYTEEQAKYKEMRTLLSFACNKKHPLEKQMLNQTK